jgi:hypothetical protein
MLVKILILIVLYISIRISSNNTNKSTSIYIFLLYYYYLIQNISCSSTTCTTFAGTKLWLKFKLKRKENRSALAQLVVNFKTFIKHGDDDLLNVCLHEILSQKYGEFCQKDEESGLHCLTTKR